MAEADFDVVVAGAGVVGLAIARQCALAGLNVAVLERNAAFGLETSARNSEVIHAALYYPAGSLKAQLCREGRDRLYAYADEKGIAVRRCGKLVVASEATEIVALTALHAQALANSVEDVLLVDAQEANRLEPGVRCVQALLSPSTGIIDSHALMLAMVGDIEALGGMIAYRVQIDHVTPGLLFEIAGSSDGEQTILRARCLVNSAGHGALPLAHAIEGLDTSRLPRQYFARGYYMSLTGAPPFRRLVYPLPAPGGLGIHATLDLNGRVRFGPDVAWVDRVDYDMSDLDEQAFRLAIARYWPDIGKRELVPDYCGIRPKISGCGEPAADFRIDGPADHGVPGLVQLFGIESPGLTSSLAIAAHVSELLGM